jgi:hypothetical protein
MTTDKNNSCHPGISAFAKATAAALRALAVKTVGKSAPGFKSAAQLRGEKADVVFTSCFGCFQNS